MNKIFFDESGYTGEDLFNVSQPVFTLASFNISESICQELKEKHFGTVKAAELKHSSLSRRPAQQNMITGFLKELKDNAYPFKVYISLKRYVLVTKIVDLIIEEEANYNGINLYKRGANIALSNLFYYVIPSLAGKKFFLEMISSFQEMIQKRTIVSYNKFFSLFFKDGLPKELDELFIYLRVFHKRFGPRFLLDLPKGSLDISYSCALTLVQEWSKEVSGNFAIVHDKSSEMAKMLRIWNRIVNPYVDPIIVGYDRRKAIYPLRVERTDLESSKSSAGLQLADILAGALSYFMRWAYLGNEPRDEYAKKLEHVLLDFPLTATMLPRPKVTPEELGTTEADAADPIEHFMDLIRQT